jgi:hypothetical protein
VQVVVKDAAFVEGTQAFAERFDFFVWEVVARISDYLATTAEAGVSQQQHDGSYSRNNPPRGWTPAFQGDYPAQISGGLAASIDVVPPIQEEIGIWVGGTFSDIEYASDQQFGAPHRRVKPRPIFHLEIIEDEPTLESIVITTLEAGLV